MKIISYNVNGIRAAIKKDLVGYIQQEQPDILCFQETKAHIIDIDAVLFESLGYHTFWNSAEKKGYSGVGIISKINPKNVIMGCEIPKIDFEGRVITAVYDNFVLVNTYFPSGTSGEERQAYKMEFLEAYLHFIEKLKKTYKKVIICGDYNICHREIDIHDPKGNKNNSGFLPEERAWMDTWFGLGMIDTFRHIYPEEKAQYSWWSQRFNARANNKGWRIDYFSITENLLPELKSAAIHPEVKHSDHCPISIQIF